MIELRPRIAEVFKDLMVPKRYKVLYGGRGAGKSTAVAQTLVVQSLQESMRIICAREFQNSISESVHQMLSEQIHEMGAADLFDIQKTKIVSKVNESEFLFTGLSRNVDSLRSVQGIKRVWIEEGHTVSKNTWKVLIPTIRAKGSEIWVTFNPDLESDETYQRFVVNKPDNAFVKKVSWRDNPWFYETELPAEMERLKTADYDEFLNVWEGHCKIALEGAVYKDELRLATEEGRITHVPYDTSKPISTYWDLGHADGTAIIFMQQIGMEYHIVDFIFDRFKKMDWYIQQIQNKGYTYKMHWLPHDGDSETVSNKTPLAMMREKGMPTQIVAKLKRSQGIKAVRQVFSNLWFDESKCYDLIKALRHYHYEEKVEDETFGKEPNHDWSSHAADALRYLAVALTDDRRKVKQPNERRGTWMSA